MRAATRARNGSGEADRSTDERSSEPLEIIGVDCAVDPRRVGLAHARWQDGGLGSFELFSPSTEAEMVEWILDRVASERPTLLALDSPLGWPVALGESLVRHSAGAPLSPEPELLFRRLTDRVVRRRIGKQPLEVGADRIARTAVAALRLIDRIASQAGSPVELAWDAGRLPGIGAIETYPASWLLYQGLPARRYKDGSEVAGERRRAILARIGEVEAEGRGASLTAAAANAHLLDAVICVLIAGEFLIGRCPAPLPAERDLARREGWIWFPLAVD